MCDICGKDIKIVYYTKDQLFGYSPETDEFWINKSEISHVLDMPQKKQITSSQCTYRIWELPRHKITE